MSTSLRPGSRRFGLALLVLLPLACGTPRVSWQSDWSAPYGNFDGDLRRAFAAARAELDGGRLNAARTRLATLTEVHPDNLELGFWLQDVELHLLERGSSVAGATAEPGSANGSPDQVLRKLYRERVTEQPSVAGFVLAARAESDALAAENLLERALELDPDCAWAHYGRAHALLRQRLRVDRWRVAREALGRAILLEPSHLRARRLEAWMLAQEGDAPGAAHALEVWLTRTLRDPRVPSEDRGTAQLDLAIAWILEGNPRAARDMLLGLEGLADGRPRRLAILAVALHELGQVEEALDAARRAEDAQPGSLLPVVQQAILLGGELDDRAAAQARWRAVAEGAGAEGAGDGNLAMMLQGLRARVELERAGVGGSGQVQPGIPR
jgi:tetratricopeptide (TPR) repeat protein